MKRWEAESQSSQQPARVPALDQVLDAHQIHRARAFEAIQVYENEIERLRSLSGTDEFVGHADRERRARLRWLLTILGEILPDRADNIGRTWNEVRSQSTKTGGPRIDRWERQTADWLVRFLEPLLPGA